MAQALGYVSQMDDGNFKGVLNMGLNARITIDANEDKEKETHPDFRVKFADGSELGGGWTKIGQTSGKEYISLTLAHPMIGPRKVYANVGRAAGGNEDEFAILWNPID